MPLAAEFIDPRLAAVYDAVCPPGADTAFWLGIAAERPGSRVVDIGCGTGLLAVEVARRGHRVTGVEPAVAMLEVARHRPDAHLVEWVAGDARALTVSGADLVVLVSHVVQLVVDDDELSATFMAAWRALAPHGRLAFDSRPPRMVRNLGFAPRSVALADGTSVEHGCELVGTDGDVAHYRLSYRFPATGETLTSDTVLRFRSLDRLTRLLQRAADADLVVEAWGDVDRRPADATTSEQLVTARRA